ncbi:hypothetical protein [Paraliobacillus ryukyuensis]|uniref:hypothetical protein n=1 Tax=Paraliobacillus ryukyuensis TaxID=200904 RepID=UPI0009A5A97C|nr:hypothetical protein [Paraliobacillus ryukyuensis]
MTNQERLESIKRIHNDDLEIAEYAGITLTRSHYEWIIQQAEEKQKLERRTKELEYASKYNGELNEFLQKRKLSPNTLGRHVVEVVMGYVNDLEKQNKRYEIALEFYADKGIYREMADQSGVLTVVEDEYGEKARIALRSK